MSDYDILVAKFQQSQSECKHLKQKLAATEAELKKLENALAPAVDEYDHLRRRLHIESECRSEAEKYASKMKKANKELKRRSMQMLQQMQLVSIDIDSVNGGMVSASSEEDLRDGCNRKIQELEESVKELESKLEAAEEEKLTAYQRELKLVAKIQELQDDNADMREKLEDFNSNMKNIKRTSNMAWKEFEELQKSYEMVVQLKNEAERFAHQMLAERDAVKRQSAMLLSSAMADERLASALLTVEELSTKLSNEQHAHQTDVGSLRQELKSSSMQTRIEELEKQLSMALSENETLLKAHRDLEKWQKKLETENVDLVNKLDIAEQKLRPAPPPPPPPPPPLSLFSPLRLFIKKKQGPQAANPAQTRAGTPRDQTYEEALKEMMERIKTGQALKPTVEISQTDKSGGSAIENLQNMLTRRQVPMDELIRRQKVQQQQKAEDNSELMTAFRKVRPTCSVDSEKT